MSKVRYKARGRARPGAVLSAVLVMNMAIAASANADFDAFNEDVENALKGKWGDVTCINCGKVNFNIRYRFEYVDQQGLGVARGDPIRLRLGYLTPQLYGFRAFAEFEGNTPIFADDYNSTRNGKRQFPVIADPAVAEVNQLWIGYNGLLETDIKAGRQRINYNNQRFVGAVAWRQLEQTFDSATIVNQTIGNTDFKFGFIWNVRNVTGRDVSMRSPILNLSYDVLDYGKATAYGYWLGYSSNFNSGPFPFAFSTQTYGLRFDGSTGIIDNLKALYTAEYAYQKDYDKNPRSYHANYFHLMGGFRIPEVGAGFSNIIGKVDWEYLGSKNNVAFQTPLGTNHAFQGWADQFLVTPPQGVRDLYGTLGVMFYGVKMAAIYHQFDSAVGGRDYGHEIDAVISKKLSKHYTLQGKYAQYYARDFKTDTQKFWLSLIVGF
jgi:Alginate export